MTELQVIILLLVSRIPMYIYAGYKAYKFRNEVLAISTYWLGILAFTSFCNALVTSFGTHTTAGIFGYFTALSIFMLAYTAKPLKMNK